MRVLAGILGCSLALTAWAAPRELVSLQKGSMHSDIDLFDVTISNTTGNAIEVRAGGCEEWPHITFRALDQAWDLRGFYTVKADFTNLGSAPVSLGIRMDSVKASTSETPQHAQGFEQLEPGETRTISVRLYTDEWTFSSPLELVGMRRAPGAALMNVSSIDRIQVFAGHVHEPCAFLVSNIRAEGSVKTVDPDGFLPFIDTYGQYRHGTWKEKIHSDDDLAAALETERRDMEAHQGATGRSRYGGWLDGPKLEATGWFRVEKVGKKCGLSIRRDTCSGRPGRPA